VDGYNVTVSPGMTCGRLNALLRPHGLVLPTVGEWEWATVAGSLATATHGGGATHGIMASAVVALQVVDGEGRVHRIDRAHPDFAHIGVGLGALGVISAVTLRCEPRFSLSLETDVVPFNEYLGDVVAQESRSEFHASVWIPSAKRVIRFAADRVSAAVEGRRRPLRFGPRTAIASLLSRAARIHAGVSGRMFDNSCSGDSGAILTPIGMTPRLVRWVWSTTKSMRAAELAFPASRAREVLACLQELARTQPSAVPNAIGIRLNAADDFTLSPCHGRATLWLDLFYRAGTQFDDAIEELAERFEARCHWGKHLVLTPASLRRRYPQWDRFVEACRRYDPRQLFANPLTNALALTGGV
jgi:FAD/FMN-containing dehydrogenase